MVLFLEFRPSKPLKQPKTPQILSQNRAKSTGSRLTRKCDLSEKLLLQGAQCDQELGASSTAKGAILKAKKLRFCYFLQEKVAIVATFAQ